MLNLHFHREKEKKISRINIITKVITAVLLIVALFFIRYTASNEFISAKKYMESGVKQTASNIRGRTAACSNELRFISEKLNHQVSDYSEASIINFLHQNVDNTDFYRLIYVFPDGKQVSYSKNTHGVSYTSYVDEETFSAVMSGETVFMGFKKDKWSPVGYVLAFATPVYDGLSKKIVGVLAARLKPTKLPAILAFNSYDEKGHSYIIDCYGNFIVKPEFDKTKEENIFDKKVKFLRTNKERIENSLRNEDVGSFVFVEKGKKYIASFARIDSIERIVLTVVPFQVLVLYMDRLLSIITLIVFLIAIVLLSLSHYSNKLLKQEQLTVYEVAFLDAITGQGNINKFKLEAPEIIKNDKESEYALIALHISDFKSMKELFGKELSDNIIKDIFNIIKHNLSEGSICVRDYEANFLVLYKYAKRDFILKYFVDKIIDEVKVYNEKDLKTALKEAGSLINSKILVNFGIYLINDHNLSFEQMCERAYIARRNVKSDIMKSYRFYDEALRDKYLKNKKIEDEMDTALEENQFKMYLQPKFNLSDGTLAGAEALVRWIHPIDGLVPPNDFIPLFEQNGFVMNVDKCIWEQACDFISQIKDSGSGLFPVSVNVSRLHLHSDSFVSDLYSLTKKYGIMPKYLELELTESSAFNDEERFLEIIQKLKFYGFPITIDDFGTGYSSLTMLRELPVDVLKLDRGFIKDTITEERGQIVIRSILDMANKLNMVTVAEGIERDDQAAFLRNAGCKIAQGYLYGKPVDVETFINTYVHENTNLNV